MPVKAVLSLVSKEKYTSEHANIDEHMSIKPLKRHTRPSKTAAAFPTSALPVKNVSLMHQFYSWVMNDVTIAFETDDFTALFPRDSENIVPGSVDVSGWRNLTTRTSRDGTITIMDFCPPPDMAQAAAQRSLFLSPWNRTRTFLEALQRGGMALGEFCMINCTDECERLTYDESFCVDPKALVSWICDDICKAAIASSAVLGAAGLALLAMMFEGTANLRSAFVLVPVV